MRPNPHPAAGSADVIRMIVSDAGVVNWEPLVRRRDRFDRVKLAVVAAKKITRLQLIDRRPALARHPEGVLAGGLDLLTGHP